MAQDVGAAFGDAAVGVGGELGGEARCGRVEVRQGGDDGVGSDAADDGRAVGGGLLQGGIVRNSDGQRAAGKEGAPAVEVVAPLYPLLFFAACPGGFAAEQALVGLGAQGGLDGVRGDI